MCHTRMGRVCFSRTQLSRKYSHHAPNSRPTVSQDDTGSSAGANCCMSVVQPPASAPASMVTAPTSSDS